MLVSFFTQSPFILHPDKVINEPFSSLQEPWENTLLNQRIIATHASLSSIDKFTPGDSLRSKCDIGLIGHNDGTLAPKLQRHGSQELGSSRHDDFGNEAISGIYDMTEWVIETFGNDLFIACDHLNAITVEILGDEFGDFHRYVRC
jgi:hypothetical protein